MTDSFILSGKSSVLHGQIEKKVNSITSSIHSLSNHVGTGSRWEDLEGDFIMIFLMASSVRGSKWESFGGSPQWMPVDRGGSMKGSLGLRRF